MEPGGLCVGRCFFAWLVHDEFLNFITQYFLTYLSKTTIMILLGTLTRQYYERFIAFLECDYKAEISFAR